MKSFVKIILLGIIALGSSLTSSQASVQLTLTSGGVGIDTGTKKFTLQLPTLTKTDGSSLSGTATMSDDGKSLTEKFAGDMTLKIRLEGDGKITYDCSNSANGIKGISINMSIPLSDALGGKYAFDQAEYAKFPADKGKTDYVVQGIYGMFKFQPASGRGFSLTVPKSWNKLQDDRFYQNTPTFEEQYLYLFEMYRGLTSFSIVVNDLTPPSSSSDNN